MSDAFENWLSDRTPESACDGETLLPGTAIGSYRIVALLGHGGFADVYRAKDEDGNDVAVKILHRTDAKTRIRFERESRILAQVRHRNFPKFLGFGTCGERPYVVTELLFPCELPTADHAVAAFLKPVMDAVDELHRRGFVHRDIKPANILCRRGGEPVLIDFGLAMPISAVQREREAVSVDESGKDVVVGTAGFSAPEQFTGQGAGRAADVHALGAVIGVCFGGQMPRSWRRIYLTATNSNPRVRYQTVTALRRAVSWRHFPHLCILSVVVATVVTLAYVGTIAVTDRVRRKGRTTVFRSARPPVQDDVLVNGRGFLIQ